MQEEWRPIKEFPFYSASSEGRIRNDFTGHILSKRMNKTGVYMSSLEDEGKFQRVRSVAKLVADTYLDPPPEDRFNTIIHLDADRSNCRADNLAWRPRPFAIKYHRRIAQGNPYSDEEARVLCKTTGEYFNDPYEAGVYFGLVPITIELDIINQRGVWPLFHLFEWAN